MYMLKQKNYISESRANDMVFAFVRYGDHSYRHITDSFNNKEVKQWFSINGYPYKELIKTIRDFNKEAVPLVENFIHSTFHLSSSHSGSNSEGCNAQVINYLTGTITAQLQGNGVLIDSDYKAKFDSAVKYKCRAIQSADPEEFNSCLIKAIASIESYFNYKAAVYNNLNQTKRIILDTCGKISIEEKFKKWIPIISNGITFNLSGQDWFLFKKQKKIRDDYAVHSKNISQGISYKELAANLNEFRDGTAKLFYNLHIFFKDNMKRSLIREVFCPDIFYE